jgi:hypothetical protein
MILLMPFAATFLIYLVQAYTEKREDTSKVILTIFGVDKSRVCSRNNCLERFSTTAKTKCRSIEQALVDSVED